MIYSKYINFMKTCKNNDINEALKSLHICEITYMKCMISKTKKNCVAIENTCLVILNANHLIGVIANKTNSWGH